jgi:hypothetical protein
MERSDIGIMNFLTEKEMEEEKLTFHKCRSAMLRQNMQKAKDP